MHVNRFEKFSKNRIKYTQNSHEIYQPDPACVLQSRHLKINLPADLQEDNISIFHSAACRMLMHLLIGNTHQTFTAVMNTRLAAVVKH
jgi:hypothetical protein